MIEERLMACGKWSIPLLKETPQSILDKLTFWGGVYVFDVRPPEGLDDATMKALSTWGGILRTKPGKTDKDSQELAWTLGGPNVAVLLGDEDGKGAIFETAITGTIRTFAQWIALLLPTGAPNGPVNIVAGAIHGIGAGTMTNTYQWQTPRQCIDNVCGIFGGEWRVNRDGTLDAGASSDLFQVSAPDVVVMRHSSGRDASIIGLHVTQLDVELDAEEYITRQIVQDKTAAYTGASGSATPYKDLAGNLLKMSKLTNEAQTPNAQAAGLAANLVAAGQTLRQQTTLSSDEYDITRDVKAGDFIWVYDPVSGLVDATNQVRYRGEIIFPTSLRVLAVSWPVERGMGVFYRDAAGVWIDLTNYVNFEPAGATFEVGAINRPLTI